MVHPCAIDYRGTSLINKRGYLARLEGDDRAGSHPDTVLLVPAQPAPPHPALARAPHEEPGREILQDGRVHHQEGGGHVAHGSNAVLEVVLDRALRHHRRRIAPHLFGLGFRVYGLGLRV